MIILLIAASIIVLVFACEQPTPSPTSTPPPTPTPTPEPTPEPTAVERLAWFDTRPDTAHWIAWAALRRMAVDDEPITQEIASLDWVVDGITADEAGALDDVSWLLRENPAIAGTALSLPWMATDGVIAPHDRRALRVIRATASTDEDLGANLLEYEWLTDGVSQHEVEALETIGEIVSPGFTTQTATGIGAMRMGVPDVSLARMDAAQIVADYPWLQDGVTASEPDALNKLVEAISYFDPHDPTFLGEFLRGDWLQDEVENVEIEAIGAWGEFMRATATIGSRAAQTVWAYNWTRDDVTSAEVAFLGQLTEFTRTMGDFHGESLDIVASYGWIADGIDGIEAAFLRRLDPLFEQAGTEDAEALQTVLGYSWVTDGLIVSEIASVRRFAYLFDASFEEDAQALKTIVGYPWLADSADDSFDGDALRAFEALLRPEGSHYVTAQEMILAFDWVSDGISVYGDVHEQIDLGEFVEMVVFLGRERPELMVPFLESDWVLDGLSYEERDGLSRVRDITFQARFLARFVDALPYPVNDPVSDELMSVSLGDEWLQGQFSDSFLEELHRTQQNLSRLVPLVRRTNSALDVAPNFAWLQDGLSLVEMQWLAAFHQLIPLIGQSKALDFASLRWFQDEIDRFDAEIMSNIWPGLISIPEIVEQVWVRDGISERDAILVMALISAQFRSFSEYEGLLLRQPNLAQRTLTLPLAGDVELYVVRKTEFPPNDPTLDLMEQITRQLEEFMGVPFPLDAAVILIIEPDIAAGEDPQYGVAYALGAHIEMVAPLYNEGAHLAVFHEMSHLYWGGHTGAPPWWTEGAAGFLPDYARDALGHESLSTRRSNLLEDTERECWDRGIDNISDYYHVEETNSPFAADRGICVYAFGELFLMEMYLLLGHDATSAAMRQLYVDARDSGWTEPITDQQIYDVLAANVPEGMEAEFYDLFDRLHGGANVVYPNEGSA